MRTLEQKVPAAGIGAYLGYETGDFLVYLVSLWLYDGGDVPAAVSAFIVGWTLVGLTLIGAWLAPHTPRPDLLRGDQ